MPATQVSPALRRCLSDDARMLLRAALSDDFNDDPLDGARSRSIKHLPPTERLQNFRGQLRLEVVQSEDVEMDSSVAIPLRITVTSSTYLLRYPVVRTGAEVSVLNRSGMVTSWITTTDGCNIQLARFLASTTNSSEASRSEILALLGALDSLDLMDMLRALGSTSTGVNFGDELICHACGATNLHVFTFDSRMGYPLTITQTSVPTREDEQPSANGTRSPLQLSIDDYVRHDDSTAEAPSGIKSDVELLVDSAVACFYEWTAAGRQRVEQIFSLLDKDDDGSVSGQDVANQLVDAGHSSKRSESIAAEMTRLLCGSDDPSEEAAFLPFVAFWIILFADDMRVSDPDNEHRVLPALHQLFLDATA